MSIEDTSRGNLRADRPSDERKPAYAADMLSGGVALVTGGTSGIGRATALAFAQAGARVVVVGRREEEGAKTRQLVEDSGGVALFIGADVTKEAEVKRMVGEMVAAYGRLDYAFNNAGNMLPPEPLTQQSEEAWDYVVEGNLKSVWFSMKHEIPAMLASGGGAIVNNASIMGHVGGPQFASYVAAKHGVLGLTRSAALEYAERGIRINAVSPGAVGTPMGAGVFGSADAQAEAMVPFHPIGRIGVPEEVAEAVVWLCSNASSFVVGHALGIDGGYTAQ